MSVVGSLQRGKRGAAEQLCSPLSCSGRTRVEARTISLSKPRTQEDKIHANERTRGTNEGSARSGWENYTHGVQYPHLQ